MMEFSKRNSPNVPKETSPIYIKKLALGSTVQKTILTTSLMKQPGLPKLTVRNGDIVNLERPNEILNSVSAMLTVNLESVLRIQILNN